MSDAALQLIVGGYAFTYASDMVTGGRLGDLFGYRRMFMIGVVSLAAASLLCGLAPDLRGTGRRATGPGARRRRDGPAGPGADHGDVPGARAQPRAGLVRRDQGVGFVSLQILGGGLIEADIFGLGWRAIFLVNVLVGVLALIAAYLVVPHPPRSPAGH